MLIRLQKALSQAGIASRRKAEEYILHGEVSIDGKIVTTLGIKIDPYKNKISFNGKQIHFEKRIYIILSKPKGYLCTSNDTHNRPIVFDLIKGIHEKIFTVGRLDKDTEGLLILTNDGDFSHKVLHPSFKIDKKYQVILDKPISPKDIKRIQKGIFIDGKKTLPCKLQLSKHEKQIYLTIYEGRKRQIRKMMDALRYDIKRLKRIQVGHLTLGNLKPGEFRHLSKSEISKLIP